MRYGSFVVQSHECQCCGLTVWRILDTLEEKVVTGLKGKPISFPTSGEACSFASGCAQMRERQHASHAAKVALMIQQRVSSIDNKVLKEGEE